MLRDNPYLAKCLDLVVKQFGKGKPDSWNDREFKELSDKIYTISNVMISVLTLKRLFGRIQTSGGYNPQEATKDGLAKYIGFENWNDFIKSQNKEKKLISFRKSKTGKVIIISIIGLFIISTYIARLFYKRIFNKNPEQITFKVINSTGEAPHTATFIYQIPNSSKDSFAIDFDDHQILPLTKIHDTIRHGYLIPYFFNIKLIRGNNIIGNTKVHVLSHGWEARLSYQTFEPTLILLPFTPNGSLYLTPEEIEKQGLDKTKGYYMIDYRYFAKFPITGDNFIFQSKIRNLKEIGGLFCMDMSFNIVCDLNEIIFNFFRKGCEAGPKCVISEKIIEGQFTNLSKFNIDLSQWHTIEYKSINKKVQVSVDNEIIFTTSYQQELGEIKGIIISTMGSGEIDFIRLTDTTGTVVYNEEFNP